MGVDWTTVKARGDKRCKQNPAAQLVRYQFIELLIRIANDKYKKPEICKTWPEAVRKLIDEDFY